LKTLERENRIVARNLGNVPAFFPISGLARYFLKNISKDQAFHTVTCMDVLNLFIVKMTFNFDAYYLLNGIRG
jgi:hypothetical protein